ncbi:MAG: choice-of-anchor P family protein [Candidatus Acidiferrales bacterium]
MDAAHRTYLYNAHGHALSGQILRPFNQLIEVQAGMSLPTTGGYGAARVDNFRLKEVVSFRAAYTQVSGSRKHEDSSHTTLVSATIEGLSILDVVTADRIVARLASHHPDGDNEPHIVLIGSHFENLRIAGCPVHVELNHDFFVKFDTYDQIKKEYQSNDEFRKMTGDPLQNGKAQKSKEPPGVLLCSLVKDMKTTCPGVERRGHVFIVPQFGKIFVAEVIAEHGKRTLSMLRLELGSPTSGPITAAEVVGNGQNPPGGPVR